MQVVRIVERRRVIESVRVEKRGAREAGVAAVGALRNLVERVERNGKAAFVASERARAGKGAGRVNIQLALHTVACFRRGVHAGVRPGDLHQSLACDDLNDCRPLVWTNWTKRPANS